MALKDFNRYFKNENEVWLYLDLNASKYTSFFDGIKKDKKIKSIYFDLVSRKKISKEKAYEKFGGLKFVVSKTKEKRRFSSHIFKKQSDVWNYLKLNASKYDNFNQACLLNPKMKSIKRILEKNMIDKVKLYSYFGGPKRSITDLNNGFSLSKDFKDESQVFDYLSIHASNYESFSKACKKDPIIKSIETLVSRSIIDGEKVYNFFGGKKYKKGIATLGWGRTEWINYLDKEASNYSSYSQFVFLDKYGESLKNIISKNKSHIITKKIIYSKYWEYAKGQERREEKACEELCQRLKSLSNVTSILPEFYITKDSRVDIKIEVNGKTFLIEVKHDRSKWSNNEIDSQIFRYKKEGSKNFYNYKDTYLCSPKGRYGLSFDELLGRLVNLK